MPAGFLFGVEEDVDLQTFAWMVCIDLRDGFPLISWYS